MNKYQEALDNMYDNYVYGAKQKEDSCFILQELVDKVPYYKELEDKATPKKPLNIWYGLTEQVGNCPNCDKKLFEPVMELAYSKDDDLEYFKEVKLSNCNRCGQAILWEDLYIMKKIY